MTKWHYIGWAVVTITTCIAVSGGDLLSALLGLAVGGIYLFLKRDSDQ